VIGAVKLAEQPLSVKEIMADAEMKNRGATDTLLSKMVRDGEIERVGKGRYSLSAHNTGKIGQTERSAGQPTESIDKRDNLSDLSDLSGPIQSGGKADKPEGGKKT
jgi:hypothetical protein